MSKTYISPVLTLKGRVVDLTQGQNSGVTDGDETEAFPFGSVGFSL